MINKYYEDGSCSLAQSKPPLVVYHSPCLDGFTAAWAMWLKHPNAEFVPGVYGQEPPDCTGRDVYLLDFSYKRAVLHDIVAVATSVTVLDHHKTAAADLGDLLESPESGLRGRFDMNKSGARLAWEWFHADEAPLFVRLVEDRDLWRFSLPDSKAMNAAFFSYDYDFQIWNRLCSACESQERYLSLYAGGVAIERKQAKDVQELVTKLMHLRAFAKAWALCQRQVPCANLPYTLASDAAGLMAESAPFAATYFQDADGTLTFSLRSRGETGVDVSEVARVYGGGGHRNAAGFRVRSLEEL